MKLWLLFLILVLFTGCNSSNNASDTNIVVNYIERVDIPFREHGYSGLPSKVISSQVGLDRLLQEVVRQAYWNNKSAFVEVLESEEIDFSKYNLLLYRMTEGSGSIGLDVQIKSANSFEALIVIDRSIPQIGTGDMAYYMLAYKVERSV